MKPDGGGPRRAAGSLALQVALRYLRSTRRDAFVSFLSAAAACGLALGVTALVLALAALAGFQGALRDEILARTPEIEITPAPGADAAALVAAIERADARISAQRLLRGRGWLLARGGATPVQLVAFEDALPGLFPGVEGGAQGLYIGSALAQRWRLEAGDTVEVVSARPTLTPMGPQPRAVRLAIAGVFLSGRAEIEDRVALPWAVGEGLIGVRGLQILLASGDLATVDATVRRIAPLLPPDSTVRTWRDLNRALLFALRLEKSLMFLGVFLIVVVAVLALASGLMLILSSKRRELGMLSAMGAPRTMLRRTFLWLAAVLAGSGAAVGLALGAGLAWGLDRGRVLRLPDQVYFLDHVPFRLQALDLLLVVGSSVGLAMLCAGWAAGRAARLRPVEALRR